MRGDRTNYGRADEGRRFTVRIYGELLECLLAEAAAREMSMADLLIEIATAWIGDRR